GRDVPGLHRVEEVAQLAALAVGAVEAREAAIRAEGGEPVAVPLAPRLGALDLAGLAVAEGLLAQAAEPRVTVDGWLIHGGLRIGGICPRSHYSVRYSLCKSVHALGLDGLGVAPAHGRVAGRAGLPARRLAVPGGGAFPEAGAARPGCRRRSI